jgi:hypothetical protein
MQATFHRRPHHRPEAVRMATLSVAVVYLTLALLIFVAFRIA